MGAPREIVLWTMICFIHQGVDEEILDSDFEVDVTIDDGAGITSEPCGTRKRAEAPVSLAKQVPY